MLELKNVKKTFNAGTVNEKAALTDLSLSVADGDFITIIGSNGAGKSTLFNAIGGSFYVDEGYLTLDGRDITFMPEHKRASLMGRLFQDPMLGTAPHMSIEENLSVAYLRASTSRFAYFSTIGDAERKLFRERLATLEMGLEDRLDNPVGLLSGGQRQALSLLMATIVPPQLLLLDEHTAALDPATAAKVLQITRDIVEEQHITCLMVTHNMNQALDMGNRTLMMDSGRIVLDVSGEKRAGMHVDDLLRQFAQVAGKQLSNDRILLSTEAD
jgi:putative ABC transport system ATP-binding protein